MEFLFEWVTWCGIAIAISAPLVSPFLWTREDGLQWYGIQTCVIGLGVILATVSYSLLSLVRKFGSKSVGVE